MDGGIVVEDRCSGEYEGLIGELILRLEWREEMDGTVAALL